MASDQDLVNEFLDMCVDSRSTGIQTLESWLSGWRPKSPDPVHVVISDLIDGLSETQRRQLVRTVRYLTDMSFFNLFTRFEQGEGPWRFELRLINTETADEVDLINDTVDREVHRQFLKRVQGEWDEE
jgi:hypothetical protein